MQHLPASFVCGRGNPNELGEVQPVAVASAAGATMHWHVDNAVEHDANNERKPAPELATLGFDKLLQFDWHLQFVDELLQSNYTLSFADRPAGLVGALLRGQGKLLPQPLPEEAMAQLRCVFDLELLLAALPQLESLGVHLHDGIEEQLGAALTGAVSIGVAAPPRGGMIPRIYLSLGIADEAAARKLLDRPMPDEYRPRQVTYAGVDCTVLRIAGLPQGIQPAFGLTDGALHFAESGRTLRSFLQMRGKALAEGIEAMPVADMPAPAGDGTVVDSFEFRLNEVALYRAFVDVWLPLAGLLQNGGATAALDRDDMPSVETIARHYRGSRGTLRRSADGRSYTMQHLGTTGGVEFLLADDDLGAARIDDHDGLCR